MPVCVAIAMLDFPDAAAMCLQRYVTESRRSWSDWSSFRVRPFARRHLLLLGFLHISQLHIFK